VASPINISVVTSMDFAAHAIAEVTEHDAAGRAGEEPTA